MELKKRFKRIKRYLYIIGFLINCIIVSGIILLVFIYFWVIEMRWCFNFEANHVLVSSFSNFYNDLKPVQVQWDFYNEIIFKYRVDWESFGKISFIDKELVSSNVEKLVTFFKLFFDDYMNNVDIELLRVQLGYLLNKFSVVWFINKLLTFDGFFISSMNDSLVLIFKMVGLEVFSLICLVCFFILWVILKKVYIKKFVFKVLGGCYLFIVGLLFFLLVVDRDFELAFFGSEFHLFRFMKYCMLFLLVLLWIYGVVCFLWCSEHCLWESYIFCILIMYICFALFVCIMGNFIVFFIVIEGLSYLTFLLLGVGSVYRKGLEVITKYFLLNGLASGVILFGIGILYWIYGTITFFEFSLLIKADDLWYVWGLLGFVCILIGLFFKIGVFPFHYWMGDVYYGCSSLALLFLSTINELVIILVFLKFLYFFNVFLSSLQVLLISFGCLTFFVGNIAGLLEKDIYRLVAYSSITNVGLLIICYSFLNLQGLVAFIFYFVVYLSLIYVLFIVLCSIGYRYNKSILDIKSVDETVWLYKYSWILAFILTLILFSLIGLPPLVGFFSKYIWLFVVIYKVGFIGILVFLLLIPVGIVYYLRLVRYNIMEAKWDNLKVVLLENFIELKKIYVYILLLSILYILFWWWFGYLFFVELEILIFENYFLIFN